MDTCLALCGRSHWRFDRCHSSEKNIGTYILDWRCELFGPSPCSAWERLLWPLQTPRHSLLLSLRTAEVSRDSLTSFIVYLPNLRIKVTIAFWIFTAFCLLVRLIRLSIRFLSVRPRVRYCFFSPKGRPLKLASRYGVRWQLGMCGFSPQM